MADFQSLDVIRRSASTDAPPQVRTQPEVAKLIDVSRCIGCKACQAACMEWNDLREEVGYFEGSYDNPADLVADLLDADALHRVGGPERQSGVADPQGRLHALRRSGLPGGVPIAGRDRAVRQRHRRFRQRELHRLRLLHQGVSIQHPAPQPGGPEGLQVHAVQRPRRGRPVAGMRQGVPDRRDRVRHQIRHDGVGR